MASRSQRTKLLAYALGFPGAREDHPWGETVVKAGKKIYCFFGTDDSPTAAVTLKLPHSNEEALSFDKSSPASYGLGKAGWVSVVLESVPPGLLEDWIEESYRAVAPRRLVAELEQRMPS